MFKGNGVKYLHIYCLYDVDYHENSTFEVVHPSSNSFENIKIIDGVLVLALGLMMLVNCRIDLQLLEVAAEQVPSISDSKF
jgi:hypothetical protein